jgi:hypothetical protein
MSRLDASNDNDERVYQDRRKLIENVAAMVWVVLLLIGAFWLVVAFADNQRQQECLARGYRACLGLELPAPSR